MSVEERKSSFLQRQAVRLVALALILGLYSLTRLPRLDFSERQQMLERFDFQRVELPPPPGAGKPQSTRPVHPSLQRIQGWISAVGASIALNDLDGDGLSNDFCHVDPRWDSVTVAPVPGTGQRFEPFALQPNPLPYHPSTMAPMGCLASDLNEDGLLDLLVYYWGRTPVAFLRRSSDLQTNPATLGRNQFMAQEVADPSQVWFTNAATFADLDGDGHLDLVVGNYFADGARILDSQDSGGQGQSMQDSMSRALNGGRNRLLLWQRAEAGSEPLVRFKQSEGVFQEWADQGWTLAVGAADLDGDLLPELYIANDFGPDCLLHNRSRPGNPHFVPLYGQKGLFTPNSKVVGRDSFKGMGVGFADLNQDGMLDIFVSNIANEWALEESHFAWVSTGRPELMQQGVAPYTDESEPLGLSRSGWSWDSRFGDFDNDGQVEAVQATGFLQGENDLWAELHEMAMGNDELLRFPGLWHLFQAGDGLSGRLHNGFFVRSASGRFFDLQEILLEAGESLDDAQVTRGIATADVDGDGRLDLAVANQWQPSYFYRNQTPSADSFLVLNLRLPAQGQQALSTQAYAGAVRLPVPTRPAVGASASLVLTNQQRLTAQVDGGNGHSGASGPELHFGLGTLKPSRVAVELRWRDPQGLVRRQTLDLAPGWHTVLLGSQAGAEAWSTASAASGPAASNLERGEKP